jgi:hypothetical protein
LAATAPAPNSRGPHRSAFGRRLRLLPATPFFQTSLPSLGPKILRRATLRMPSDEALRVTLVCTLPLLHFSPSLVAVINASAFGEVPKPRRCHLAVPPPLFVCLSTRVDASPGFELPSRTHSFRDFSNGRIFRFSLFGFQWVLGSSKVCLQPLESIPKACATRTAIPKFRISRYLLQSRAPVLRPSGAPPPLFPTAYSLDSHESPSGYGPGLTNRVRLHTLVWSRVLPCALLSQRTRCRGLTLSLLRVSFVPRPLREVLAQFPFVHRHLYSSVLSFPT